MIRMATAVIMALCLGAAGGAYWVKIRVAAEAQNATTGGQALGTANAVDLERIKLLDAENNALHNEIQALMEDVKYLEARLAEAPKLDAILSDATPNEEKGAAPAEESAEQDRRGRRDPREARSPRPEWIEAQQAQIEAAMQRRENLALFLEDRLRNSPSQAERERAAAILDYQNYMEELRQSMMAAQSPDDRRAIFEQMNQAREAAQEVLREQQNAELSKLAAERGVPAAEAGQFAVALREVMRGPYFEMEWTILRGGAGPMGPGGPRGGAGWPQQRGGGRGAGLIPPTGNPR